MDKIHFKSLSVAKLFFQYLYQNKINLNFVKFLATKKVRHKFSPLLFVAVVVVGSEFWGPGPWIDKNQVPGSGINIPDPQTLLVTYLHPSPGKALFYLLGLLGG